MFCPTPPPTWAAVRKYCDPIGVPLKPLAQFPSHCQPLFALVPVGAEVLRVADLYRMTALADGAAKLKAETAAQTAAMARRRRRGRSQRERGLTLITSPNPTDGSIEAESLPMQCR